MPVHGPLSLSALALRSLAALSPPPEQFVIVMDVPPDAADSVLLPAGAIVVQVPYASGPARARNAGAEAVSSGLLLFIDADVVVPPDTVSRVKNEFMWNPGVSALFGSYDTMPGDPNFLSQYRNLMHHFVHQRANDVAGTFWGGLGAIWTEAFWSVGGFNESYGVPSIEDIELGVRLRAAGCKIRLVKDLQGCHLKRWTVFGMLKTDLWQRGVPWMRLILARGRIPSDLNTGWSSRWSTALAWCGVMVLPWAWSDALWSAVAIIFLGMMLALNLSFYRFLANERGIVFALHSMPWHVLYFLECGLAGVIGLFLHFRDRFFNLKTELIVSSIKSRDYTA